MLAKLLLTALLFTPIPTTHLQNTPSNKEAQKQAEKERREREKAEQRASKEAKKLEERAAKERLKRPAEIQIKASAERVGALIVQGMNRYGYQIADEGKYRLVFTQEVTGFRGSLAQSMTGSTGPPLRTASFTISQLGDVATVSVDLSVQFRKPFGRVDRADMNRNKDWRREMDQFLILLKTQAEQ